MQHANANIAPGIDASQSSNVMELNIGTNGTVQLQAIYEGWSLDEL